jgi:hypothetical protein
MRKKRSGVLLSVFLLVGFALALSNCGSGGGTITLAELTADNAPQVAGSMDQVMSLIDPASSLGEIEVAAASSGAPLARVIDTMKAISEKQLPSPMITAQDSMYEEIPCDSGSGTVSADWDESDLITDPFAVLDLKVTMHFVDCTMGEETLDGSATMKFTGTFSDPTKITITSSNLNYKNAGSPDGETDITMTGFSMDVTSTPSGGTMTISGKVSGVSDGVAVDEELDDLVLTMEAVPGGGEVTIAGNVKPSCVGGWITLSTATPIFIPVGEECPTDGNVQAASDGNVVSIVVGPGTTETTVYFNDAEVASYPDCEGVGGLCS